jgi:putative FmdB family regulatory protein
MPMYEFRCEPCDHAFETLVRSSSDTPHCPKCKGIDLQKQFSVPAAARATAGAGVGGSLPMTQPQGGGGCGAPWCGTGGCGGMG